MQLQALAKKGGSTPSEINPYILNSLVPMNLYYWAKEKLSFFKNSNNVQRQSIHCSSKRAMDKSVSNTWEKAAVVRREIGKMRNGCNIGG